MAAPTLVSAGNIGVVTSGNLTVVIPTHGADDILIVTTTSWAPNSAPGVSLNTTPTDWNLGLATVEESAGNTYGWTVLWWRRATGSGTTFTLVRPGDWDTGTDTCFAGRAYLIRGCVTSGNPWDQITSVDLGAANVNFPAVTVSGSERTVVQFHVAPDNSTISAAVSGWTSTAQVTTTTGTDAGFGSFRKENVSSSTSADATTNNAPANGQGAYIGVSFKAGAATLSADGTASGSGTGTATGTATYGLTGTGTGTGTGTASGTATYYGLTGTGTGTGTQSATAIYRANATATAAGSGTVTGDATVITVHVATGTGSGSGTTTATAIYRANATAAESGSGTATATAIYYGNATATAAGNGTGTATAIYIGVTSATGTGTGTGTAAGTATFRGNTATGSGSGTATATAIYRANASASAAGTGTGTADGTVLPGSVTHDATGTGTGSGTGSATAIYRASAIGFGYGLSDAQAVAIYRANVTATASATATGIATAVSNYIADALYVGAVPADRAYFGIHKVYN